MDPKVHYKTQSAAFEKVSVGPSTDTTFGAEKAYKQMLEKYHEERDTLHWIKYGRHLPKRKQRGTAPIGRRQKTTRRANDIANSLLDLVS